MLFGSDRFEHLLGELSLAQMTRYKPPSPCCLAVTALSTLLGALLRSNAPVQAAASVQCRLALEHCCAARLAVDFLIVHLSLKVVSMHSIITGGRVGVLTRSQVPIGNRHGSSCFCTPCSRRVFIHPTGHVEASLQHGLASGMP